MIQADPWAGAGPAHFAHYGRDLPFGAHPHNWVLQIGSEWGLPALVCLCAALLLSFRRLSRHGNFASENKLALPAAWWVTGTAIVVDGLFSGIILMP